MNFKKQSKEPQILTVADFPIPKYKPLKVCIERKPSEEIQALSVEFIVS